MQVSYSIKKLPVIMPFFRIQFSTFIDAYVLTEVRVSTWLQLRTIILNIKSLSLNRVKNKNPRGYCLSPATIYFCLAPTFKTVQYFFPVQFLQYIVMQIKRRLTIDIFFLLLTLHLTWVLIMNNYFFAVTFR